MNSPKITKKKRNNEFIPMSQKKPMMPEIVKRYMNKSINEIKDEIKDTSEQAKYRIAKLKYDEELAAWNRQQDYVNKIINREPPPKNTTAKQYKKLFLNPPTTIEPNKLEKNPLMKEKK
jgi:hypothetical protein